MTKPATLHYTFGAISSDANSVFLIKDSIKMSRWSLCGDGKYL